MECICEELSDGLVELSPTCLRHHWIFGNLHEKTLKTLRKSAIRKKIPKGAWRINHLSELPDLIKKINIGTADCL